MKSIFTQDPVDAVCRFDKKPGISLENSLVPLKTVSLLSKREIARVRTAKNPENKQEIEQFLARSQSMLPSPKFIIVFENREYISMLKEKLMEIKRLYKSLNLVSTY